MGNTLSDHGHVNRGVCKVDDKGFLQDIVETRRIVKTAEGIFAPGKGTRRVKFTENDVVSMNLWGFKPSCFDYLEKEFASFIRKNIDAPGSELDIPTSMDIYIKRGEISIKVLMTEEKWFGVTYREDRPFVVESLMSMVDDNIYPEKLW